MRIKDFIYRMVTDNSCEITKMPYGVSRSFYVLITEATKHIDYHCEFDEGICKNYKNKTIPQCCCSGCYGCYGYMKVLPPDYFNLLWMARRYQPAKKGVDGFWRKDGGCILPRALRSLTCLKHRCWSNFNGDFIDTKVEPLHAYYIRTILHGQNRFRWLEQEFESYRNKDRSLRYQKFQPQLSIDEVFWEFIKDKHKKELKYKCISK